MDTLLHIVEIALPLFLIMDPLGNSPVILGMLREYEAPRQRRIILRELCFALAAMVLFQFFGQWLLDLLKIQQPTLRIAGGIILFVISMNLIFPGREGITDSQAKDPFIVPIAIPLLAGPSLLAAIMLYAHREESQLLLLSAMGLAWSVVAAIILAAPFMTRVLGPRGMRASGRLMGLVLILLSVQMLLDGVRMFIATLD